MVKRKMYLFGLFTALAVLTTACPKQDGAPDGKDASPKAAGGGANYYGWASDEATALMKASDAEVDDVKRTEQIRQIGKLAADDIVNIPLFAKPQILVVNTAKLDGNFDFNAGQAGFAHKLKGWSVKGSKQLVFGAEQWPECLNPITSCASASWLSYTAVLPTQAQLLTLDDDNNYAASPLVTEIPTLENKGLTADPFSVTFNLNPAAKWEDGTKITGEDVKFTWEAKLKTADVYTKTGYEDIEDVVTAGDKVTIKFKKPFAAWKDLFGGGSEVVLKKAAFPDGPNLQGKMATDLAGISGNAFKLESFDENQMVLSRNDKYWGPQAKVDKLVFRKIEKSNDEVEAFRTGEIHAFFPQPTTELVDKLKAIAGSKIQAKAGTVYEGLWFNLDAFPVNDRAVREALLYGIDRQAAIDAIIKPIDPAAAINTCSFSVKNLAGGKYCGDDFSTEFSPEKAIAALEKGGWKKNVDKDDPETITSWTKKGKTLVVRLATTAGNAGREQAQLIFQRQLSAIGIELRADNSLAGVLFQTRLPARDFTVGMFAQVATPDPTVTANFSKDAISGPSAVSSTG